MLFTPLIVLFASVVHLVFAEIQITKPDASTIWKGDTTVTLSWTNSDPSYKLDGFSTYTVWLCYGSNATPMCDKNLTPQGSPFSPTVRDVKFMVESNAGPNAENVYFVKLEVVASTGGKISTYSNRFSLTSMSATQFPAAAIVEQKKGDVAPPDPEDTTSNGKGARPTSKDAKNPGQVPYSLQTGKTRYAPIQTQPGPKITATVVNPQYPTSRYSTFTTFGPRPTIDTTITLPWDYSVTTKVNTATPAPHPKDYPQHVLN